MIILGLVLILVAFGGAVFAVASSSNAPTQIPLHGIGVTLSVTPLTMYLAGALSVICLGLGFAMILRGTGRQWGRHKEHKELKVLREKNATAATETADGSAVTRAASTGNDSDTGTAP